MDIQIEERYVQPESGGWFSSVLGLPGRALEWCGRALGFGGNPVDMAQRDCPEMQARDLDERESSRPVPQDFTDAFCRTSLSFAAFGTDAIPLFQLAASTDDPGACVEWMAKELRHRVFHNENFVNEVTRLFVSGELTAGALAVAFMFYLSRIGTFLTLGNLSNRAEFLRFAIQLAFLLQDPKQGAKEVVNAYIEALANFRPEGIQDFLQRMTGMGIPDEFTQIAIGLKKAKDAIDSSEQEQFKEKVYEISDGVGDVLREIAREHGYYTASTNGLMAALYAQGVLPFRPTSY